MSKLVLHFDNDPPVNLRTLFNRIPDDVVLAASTRPMDMGDGLTCLCGWVIREEIARVAGGDAEGVSPYVNPLGVHDVVSGCAERFGGALSQWYSVFSGVCYRGHLPLIETAWVERVDKAVRRA